MASALESGSRKCGVGGRDSPRTVPQRSRIVGGPRRRVRASSARWRPRRPSWPFSRTLGRGRCAGVWTGRIVEMACQPERVLRRRLGHQVAKTMDDRSGQIPVGLLQGSSDFRNWSLGACHSCGGSSSRWSWRSPVRNATERQVYAAESAEIHEGVEHFFAVGCARLVPVFEQRRSGEILRDGPVVPGPGEFQAWVGGRIIVNCPSLTVAEVGGDIDDNDLVAIARTRRSGFSRRSTTGEKRSEFRSRRTPKAFGGSSMMPRQSPDHMLPRRISERADRGSKIVWISFAYSLDEMAPQKRADVVEPHHHLVAQNTSVKRGQEFVRIAGCACMPDRPITQDGTHGFPAASALSGRGIPTQQYQVTAFFPTEPQHPPHFIVVRTLNERGQSRQGRVRLNPYRREDAHRERITVVEFRHLSGLSWSGPARERVTGPSRVHHGFGETFRLPAMALAGTDGIDQSRGRLRPW